MEQKKIIAIVAVIILLVAAIGVIVYTQSEGDEPQKKGLYRLDATVSDVNMGQCSATPGVILTFEQMYADYYGELVDDTLTIEDAKKDTEFWNKYGQWTPIIKDNGDGTYTVESVTGAKGHESETLIIPPVDTVVSLGTMYTETMYFLACTLYGVEPYTEEGLHNADVCGCLQSHIAGGMSYDYYVTNEVEYMLSYIDKSSYLDLGVNSVQTVEKEKLMQILEDAGENGTKEVLYLASGTRLTTDYYDNNVEPCKKTGSYYAFFGPTEISEVYSSIECIGHLTGFDDKTIQELIENIQLRLYKVYHSVQEKTDGTSSGYAYWESSSGKAIKSAMGKIIVEFLGFDSKLLDGAEHDMESLLQDKPSYLIFYTNDTRTDAEKMRTNI